MVLLCTQVESVQEFFNCWALFLYKVLHGCINLDPSTYVQFFSDSDRYLLRGKDEYALKKNYATTDTFKFSFFSRIVGMWNT